MKDINFYEKIISRLQHKIHASYFIELMVSNFDCWQDIENEDIERIIFNIRHEHYGLYAFLPFCYKVLGVDMFRYYIDTNNSIWKEEKCYDMVKYFGNYPVELHQLEIAYLERNGLNPNGIKNVRNRLIEKGAIGVPKVKQSLRESWIVFDE